MGQSLQPRVIHSGGYVPTTPRSGDEGDSIIWGQRNLITRGLNGHYYEDASAGPLETARECAGRARTGARAFTAGEPTSIGTGTLFQTEARPPQRSIVID